MTSPTLVSVVTIFLNAERFLAESIDSVLAQHYPYWELLLVDDGSTDESSSIARRYAAQRPDQIRYLEHPGHVNLGTSASRNAGVRAARGSLVAFLDADDVWLPEKLARQVSILEREPRAAMVYGATEHWYSWTERAEDRARDKFRRLGVAPDTLLEPPSLVERYLNGEAQTPGTCGLLVRRSAVEEVGGFDEQFPGMFEDWNLIVKICLRHPVFVESGRWDRYRQHAASLSASARARGSYAAWRPSADEARFLSWLEQYARAGRLDAGIADALARALRPYRNPMVYRWRVGRYWLRLGPLWLWKNVRARVARWGGHLKALVRWRRQHP